jgi:hypothetical protein
VLRFSNDGHQLFVAMQNHLLAFQTAGATMEKHSLQVWDATPLPEKE